MLFSIIIPAYNAEDTIEKCVNSVKKQTLKEFEIIVANDGSTDKTLQKVKSLLDRNDIIIDKQNGGVSSARNAALDKARGEYIVFLDADDLLPEKTLELYKENIVENNYPDMICGNFLKKYPKTETTFKLTSENKKQLICQEGCKEFNPYNPRLSGTVWAKCYKKTAIGAERFDEKFSLCEDAEFNFRVLPNFEKFIYVNQCIYIYTYNLNSAVRQYKQDKIDKYISVISKMLQDNRFSNIEQDFLNFASNVFNVICFNMIFTKKNQCSYKVKIEQVSKLREDTVFKEVLEKVNRKEIKFKHRVSVYFALKRQYVALYAMSWINQLLNKIIY